jgi:putative Ca2+/H+ antiporter (TMEM165/GDT1 family)
MEGLPAFAAALALVALLELGDKTQLATISLAARHPWRPVLAGSAAALVGVTAIGAAIGGLFAAYLGAWLPAIQIGGGALFLGFGAWTLLRREEEAEPVPSRGGAFATAFVLTFVAELGDKTQIAVVVLAATTLAPVSVFAGAAAGLVAIATTSVLIGSWLARVARASWLRIGSAVAFLAAGVLLVAEAVLFP